MDHAKLKEMRKRLATEQAREKALRDQIADMQRDHAVQLDRVLKLKKQIAALTPTELELTEHAMLRYLMRTLQIEETDIQEKIITDTLRHQVNVLGGTGKFPVADGFKAVIRDNKIVTIY